MSLVVLCFVFFLFGINGAPTPAEQEAVIEESPPQVEKQREDEKTTEEDAPQTRADEKNPVQEWFENLSKNASTNAQNTMNTLKEWFSTLTPNSNLAPPQNLPTMYMGSFQLLKMPMPQITDVIKGMGDLATLAQTFNKVTGGGGLPGLPQLLQGIPLISQG